MTHAQRPTDANIDTLILQAEQRLVEREERWRRDVGVFGRELHAATRPARLLKPALVGVAVLLALRPRPSPAVSSHAEPQAPAAPPALWALLAGIPWTRFLSHAWPMLPARWRERLNPATAASLLTLGLPVLEGLIARRRSPR
jgi:hypothetical protein